MELPSDDLPPGWKRILQQNLDENGEPQGRWAKILLRQELRIIEDCNPEADVAKYKHHDPVQRAWDVHEGKPGT